MKPNKLRVNVMRVLKNLELKKIQKLENKIMPLKPKGYLLKEEQVQTFI